ncbi:hypothetical protein ACFPIJ_12045 [Dactylosporangium cerinum]|uniref:RAMA domain-containing protein n=1 Tax=Dactylosporangium cerinum TaxID=1434730 RepID=A0ABV9VQZ2_9ACTN
MRKDGQRDANKIDADDQVYAPLRELGRTGDTFNGVLRKLLRLPGRDPSGRRRHRPGKRGLGTLVHAGLLQPGQRLTWARPRLDERHTVTVDADGNLITEDGSVCATPDSAAAACTGYLAADWPAFCTDDGVSLETLRNRLAGGQTGNARQHGAPEG